MEWMGRWEDVERKGKFERTEGKCETTRRRAGEHEARRGKQGNERMDKGPGNREYDGKNVSTEKGQRKVMREIK